MELGTSVQEYSKHNVQCRPGETKVHRNGEDLNKYFIKTREKIRTQDDWIDAELENCEKEQLLQLTKKRMNE